MNKLIIGLIVVVLLILLFFVLRNYLFAPSLNEEEKVFNKSPESNKNVRSKTQIEGNKREFIPKYTSDVFQAGMNMLVYGHPNMDTADKMFNRLQELGINSVAIVFPFYQEGWRASEVKMSPTNTPTLTELQGLIEKAHDHGLSVMLRPILDEENIESSNKWRGLIEPTDPDGWFDSYQSLLSTYAQLAQSTNVKALNIGTELNSLEQKYDHKWMALIEEIRQVYDGELIYSFNWDVVGRITKLEFSKYLDHIGVDAYFPLDAPDDASVSRLKKEWKKWMLQVRELLNHRPVIVTEVGTLPVAGSYRTPYSWTYPNGKLDLEAQARYYEATFDTWEPVSHGIYWWCVTLDEGIDEAATYSPLNLPTENIITNQLLEK